MKETRNGKTLHIDLDEGEAIDGPRELHGPLVIQGVGNTCMITGPASLQGPIEINGCRFDGTLSVPRGVSVTFASVEEPTACH